MRLMIMIKMTYRRLALLIGFLILVGGASADVRVFSRGENRTLLLKTETINDCDYVELDTFNAMFNSITKQERTDHRLHLFVYGEQFIFLVNSPYYTFRTDTYNMHVPLIRKGTRFFLPQVFVVEHLKLHFPKDVDFKNSTLQINKPKDKSVKVIVLDPGHGGNDPGAVGFVRKLKEKDVNLAVCLKLKPMLEKELGVTVLMTRSDDRFITLQNRTKFANENRADIFVSVHTNASNSRTARGVETFYLSTALTSDARAVEALENNVVEQYEGGAATKQKYDNLAFILSDLSQTEHLENSNNMALLIQQNLVAGTKSVDRGVKQANFYVLRGAFMPAVLIELGFITNAEEEALLANEQYQERLARTIFEGLKRFKFRFDRIRNT